MFDNIIYRHEDTYLIEVDASLVTKFLKFLSMYNIRSKAKIAIRDEPVYVSFIPGSSLLDGGYIDPRLPLLGCRHIGSPPEGASTVSLSEYDRHRVSLGVSEGSRDITSGKDFPFEHNLDFLNGVSFSKGCYIGQELTARTHHVGETRKRVVPVKMTENVEDIELPARISKGSRAAGKLLSVYGNIGLAVLRFPYLDQELSIKGSDVKLVGSKPSWWPEELR
ncbi:putative transferase CAF17 homolog, mitochondrial [Bolinopsis microptera]|uniref:putative transferase CAF17 homolog, mitochondrial n=1 Tax=Bolinopsis microptera TaxID=2820187 RepID=UPI003078AC75